MRAPQAPQKANPGWTGFPQVGQAISPPPVTTGGGVGASPAPELSGPVPVPPAARARTGGGVTIEAALPPLVSEPVTWGPGVAPPSELGGRPKGMGAGTLGESFHGMPPRGLAAAGEGVRSSPATAEAGGPGGSIVRAVSSDGSGAGGVAATGAGMGTGAAAGDGAAAGFTSSLPQPRQNL